MPHRKVYVALSFAVSLLLVACLGFTSLAQTTLIFYNPHVDEPYVTARQKAVERFEAKHPGVVVEMVTPGSGYVDKMLLAIASGNPPDIMATNTGADVWRLVRDGIVRDVTEFWERDKEFADAFSPHIMNEVTLDDKVWGVPISILAAYVIWYNQNTFSEVGLANPDSDWTHDDFLAIARRLARDTDGDGVNDRFAYTYHSWLAWKPWIYNRGGRIADDSLRKQRLTDPETIAAFEWLIQMEHDYNVVPRVGQVASRNRDAYSKGDVAMVQAGPFFGAELEGTMPYTSHGMVLEPAGPTGQLQMMTTHAAMITTHSKHPELAWELLKELASYETLADLAVAFSSPVPRLDVFRNVFMELPPAAGVAPEQWYGTLGLYFERPLFSGNDVPQAPNFTPVFNGEKPPRQYFAEIADSFQKALDDFWASN